MLERRSSVRVLEVDPDLGAELAPGDLAAARRELVVSAGALEPGAWQPLRELPDPRPHLGVLVVEGLLLRDVVVADTACAELVGEGDVLRPWEDLGRHAPMPYDVEWRALEPTTLAILDGRATEVICRYPPLAAAVVARTVARAHALAYSLAITCMTGVRVRLLVLLWHLADRWGKVTPEGVVVSLDLTHAMLGRLVGARRPSVSTALGELADAGLVRRTADGWVLRGDPPEDLKRMHDRRLAGARSAE